MYPKCLTFYALKTVLNLHSFTYKLAGRLSQKVEKEDLHPKHRIMNYHKFFVDNIHENDRVLDVGCGNGALSYEVSLKANKVIGIDFSEKNIDIARKKYSGKKIEYICGDALKYLPEEKFDVVILSNVLEHIDERVEFLNKLKTLSSRFLIRVPMIDRSWIDVYKKELGLEYRLDDTHFIEYTFESFRNEMDLAKLKITDYTIQFGEIWSVVVSI